ncbi:hypothetical protein BDA96_03G251100 [Sorghum bicolor]|uniref:Secreted protein n=2 Tax=Sorghum bicolor TaxID=4558 RepID=A0A921RE71_SORBI|nr:hypothetical protein BDA96_03G251100 [Sorghum bicolor]OQU87204.1 hypothetical protein SORBI_3003G232001 [Sorghum bicolor]
MRPWLPPWLAVASLLHPGVHLLEPSGLLPHPARLILPSTQRRPSSIPTSSPTRTADLVSFSLTPARSMEHERDPWRCPSSPTPVAMVLPAPIPHPIVAEPRQCR